MKRYLAILILLFASTATAQVEASSYNNYISVMRAHCDPLCNQANLVMDDILSGGDSTVRDLIRIMNRINSECWYLNQYDPAWCQI